MKRDFGIDSGWTTAVNLTSTMEGLSGVRQASAHNRGNWKVGSTPTDSTTRRHKEERNVK